MPQCPTQPSTQRQITGPDLFTPKVEVINFQQQAPPDLTHNEDRESTSNSINDYNAYGMDNFHQDLESDLDQSTQYYEHDRISGYFVQALTQFICATCYSMFRSCNKLFKHLREMKHQTASMVLSKSVANIFMHSTKPSSIITSNAPPVVGSGMAFRNSNFLEVALRPTPSRQDYFVCLDTGCEMSCIDRNFFKKEFTNAVVQTIPPIEICGLGNKIHQFNEYFVITLYFPKYNKHDTYLAVII